MRSNLKNRPQKFSPYKSKLRCIRYDKDILTEMAQNDTTN